MEALGTFSAAAWWHAAHVIEALEPQLESEGTVATMGSLVYRGARTRFWPRRVSWRQLAPELATRPVLG